MRIENVFILMSDGVFRKGSVDFGKNIENIELHEGGNSGADYYLIPGLVDIHTHGAVKGDHSDGSCEEMQEMGLYYAKNGVTSFLATTMTYGEEKLSGAIQNIAGYERPANGAKCLGINMEGPFLSYEKRGAHLPEALLPPDLKMFERLYKISGNNIRLASIAPELDGAMEFIREVSQVCKVSLAHTAAGYDVALKAFGNGATHVTHLYNAMSPFLHRDPGVIGAAKDAGAFVELICDGVHSHPSVVRATYDMFNNRICMISDSIRSAGLPDGKYESGGMPIVVQNGKAVLENGTIAGSNISLMQGVRCAVNFGIPLAKAVMAATAANARALDMESRIEARTDAKMESRIEARTEAKMESRIGELKPGASSDMVLLDKELDIQNVFINGEKLDFS
jgi:N-acetylglucosamine-6-phosphate deacetylase